eukprot:CAMPEP_0172470572 /NCGR_PEP_ID=MMETSP1065-20121228/66714_1 /TAXON_ID=265537 /ORGANISM="Amphiprora paludosa, Strain CCMP125" /LENGTH=656 /DNA_ID=CAMNT_0013228565 /DNA_START=29 /DNA_END=1999 /DNA_ORIENTATION=+
MKIPMSLCLSWALAFPGDGTLAMDYVKKKKSDGKGDGWRIMSTKEDVTKSKGKKKQLTAAPSGCSGSMMGKKSKTCAPIHTTMKPVATTFEPTTVEPTTLEPTMIPTSSPVSPSSPPSQEGSELSSYEPSEIIFEEFSVMPSGRPSMMTEEESASPSDEPTAAHISDQPSGAEISTVPSLQPSEIEDSDTPSIQPTDQESSTTPSTQPTDQDISTTPSTQPTEQSVSTTPSSEPTNQDISTTPSAEPTNQVVTTTPSTTSVPSSQPPVSRSPSSEPEWTLVPESPFEGELPHSFSGYGSSVAIAGNFIVAGEPGFAQDRGRVYEYQREPSTGVWSPSGSLIGLIDSEALGSAVDLAALPDGTTSMLVGAEDTRQPNFLRFGSATYYEFDPLTGQRSQVGSTMLPEIQITETGGEFGGVVAMATDIRRVVIGAPSSSLDISNLNTGRVYTFEYDEDVGDWAPMADAILGVRESFLGSALDMSRDGSRILAGAPLAFGGTGVANLYEWNGSTWIRLFRLTGELGQQMGTSVAFLNDDASRIAFGGPGSDRGGEGIIRVYQDRGGFFQGFFESLGDGIVGLEGENIGKTLAGAGDRVAFGTDTGSFRVYEWMESQDTWLQVATGPLNLGAAVVSISMSEDAKTVVVGLANEQVQVYNLE